MYYQILLISFRIPLHTIYYCILLTLQKYATCNIENLETLGHLFIKYPSISDSFNGFAKIIDLYLVKF